MKQQNHSTYHHALNPDAMHYVITSATEVGVDDTLVQSLNAGFKDWLATSSSQPAANLRVGLSLEPNVPVYVMAKDLADIAIAQLGKIIAEDRNGVLNLMKEIESGLYVHPYNNYVLEMDAWNTVPDSSDSVPTPKIEVKEFIRVFCRLDANGRLETLLHNFRIARREGAYIVLPEIAMGLIYFNTDAQDYMITVTNTEIVGIDKNLERLFSKVFGRDDVLDKEKECVMESFTQMTAFLYLLHTKGVAKETSDHKKWNEKRVKNGQVPLTDYTYLRIGKVYDRSGNEVKGHHDLSKIFWRRGHTRNQPCGRGRMERKTIYISPHLVNYDPATDEIPAHKTKILIGNL